MRDFINEVFADQLNPHVAPMTCSICGVGFQPCDIPYAGICSNKRFHIACYREQYGAQEFDAQECVQPRHREA